MIGDLQPGKRNDLPGDGHSAEDRVFQDLCLWTGMAMQGSSTSPDTSESRIPSLPLAAQPIVAAHLDFPSLWSEQKLQGKQAAPDFRGQGGPAAIRYNNPGAMYPHESSRKFGSTVTHTIGAGHLIAEFPDAISGAAAQFDLLDSWHYHNLKIAGAIDKWSGHNGVAAYQHALRNAGIDLQATVGDVLLDKEKAISFASTMAKVEAGREYPLSKEQWGAAFDKHKDNPPGLPAKDGSDCPEEQPEPSPERDSPGDHRDLLRHHHHSRVRHHRHDGDPDSHPDHSSQHHHRQHYHRQHHHRQHHQHHHRQHYHRQHHHRHHYSG